MLIVVVVVVGGQIVDLALSTLTILVVIAEFASSSFNFKKLASGFQL